MSEPRPSRPPTRLASSIANSTYPLEALKEIRDFPKAHISAQSYGQLMDWCIRGLENCVRLKSCTWTSDGSLTSEILKSLRECPELTDIAINGGDSWQYEPKDLIQLLHLRTISLVMPSMSVLEILPRWLQITGQSLTSLTLICKASIHVTDALLDSISQHLPQLERLYLAGCPRVTNNGVWSMIRSRVRNLKGLSLESLSPVFNMSALSEACARAGGLTSLYSFTLTIPPDHPSDAWMDDTASLLRDSPLQVFQIYASGSGSQGMLADEFCMRIVDYHHDHLVRFSFHRLRLSLDAIDHVCLHCTRLEQLFMLIDHAEMELLIPILAGAKHLSTVHVNLVERPTLCSPYKHALDIAHKCSPSISQVGIDTKVWKVDRRVSVAEGITRVDRFLTMVESPDIPEQFLVVRT
ncbi:hypothetical protein B0F90DRAFT_1701398 [Multifurca ochricompacta]|uniref:RNI-like protein n=1 Tax=Multifurca ochricompacta TaxID=376703 RepID=A0AAD4QMT7_9AGAM|nr:hypothetical protein B0F90DRAFT_1701398 [Multifurca ochricompacta]